MSYREERVWLINPFSSDTVWTLLVIAIRHDSTMISTSLHYNQNTVPHPYCVHLTKCWTRCYTNSFIIKTLRQRIRVVRCDLQIMNRCLISGSVFWKWKRTIYNSYIWMFINETYLMCLHAIGVLQKKKKTDLAQSWCAR